MGRFGSNRCMDNPANISQAQFSGQVNKIEI